MLLSIAARKLAKRNVLVKDLHGVETLGAITLLATDKTGTLTQNRMTVVGMWTLGGCELHGQKSNTAGSVSSMEDHRNLDPNAPPQQTRSAILGTILGREMARLCALCNRCQIMDKDKPELCLSEKRIIGDATEKGLLRFAALVFESELQQSQENCSQVRDIDTLRERHPKVHEVPFNSTNKWQLSVHQMASSKQLRLLLKGAPERVLARCSRIAHDEASLTASSSEIRNSDLDSASRQRVLDAYEEFARRGQRVIACAMKPFDSVEEEAGPDWRSLEESDQLARDCIFLGLVALMDPAKKGVRKAIHACRTAGIQVVMVTGDHPTTALAIARSIGLVRGETAEEVAVRLERPLATITGDMFDAVVVHGDTLDPSTFSDADWDRVMSKREVVFARTSPAQKLEIVTRFQRKGHIVGVSGDGVNDSPALKKADLGISMNISGSDVSKEAAAMILLDDNFSSIIAGIVQGTFNPNSNPK